MCSCQLNKEKSYPHSIKTADYYGYAFNESEAAIGGFRKIENEFLFFPLKITEKYLGKKYEVIQLGYRSVTYSQLDGVYSTPLYEKTVTRFYIPGCINSIYETYFQNYSISGGVKFFYCGKTINLMPFQLGNIEEDVIYVPYDRYQDFIDKSSNLTIKVLKANVEYYLNFETEELYYIDFCENDEKIQYIPPVPVREGYVFDGWYNEPECLNEWNFEENKILFDFENFNITKLYAKWIKK